MYNNTNPMHDLQVVSQSLQNDEKDYFLEGVSLALRALLGVVIVLILALCAMYFGGVFTPDAEARQYCEPTPTPTNEPTITPSISLEPSVSVTPTALLEPSTTPFHPSATPFHPTPTSIEEEPLPTVCPGRTKGGICP